MSDIRFPVGDEELPGYSALPTGTGPWPGVVVLMDALGVTADLRRITDHIADAGYLALAPDLYARKGMVRCVAATVRASRTGSGPAYDDIDAARRYLVSRPDCTGSVGVIGFCMGGGFALASTWKFPFAASAVNYGFVPDDVDERLRAGGCPIVGSFGARDRFLRGHPERLERALQSVGPSHDVKIYPGVGHSFLNRFPVGPLAPLLRVTGLGYDEDVAKDAWARIFAFFDEHLRGEAA